MLLWAMDRVGADGDSVRQVEGRAWGFAAGKTLPYHLLDVAGKNDMPSPAFTATDSAAEVEVPEPVELETAQPSLHPL